MKYKTEQGNSSEIKQFLYAIRISFPEGRNNQFFK